MSGEARGVEYWTSGTASRFPLDSQLRRKLPHGAVAVGSAACGGAVYLAAGVNGQTPIRWQIHFVPKIKVLVMPTIAGIRSFEDEIVEALGPAAGIVFTRAAQELLSASPCAVEIAGCVDGKIVQVLVRKVLGLTTMIGKIFI